MKGICSNSPTRCRLAYSLKATQGMDGDCPECGSSLVAVDNEARPITLKQYHRVLLGLLLLLLMLNLISIYWFFVL